MKNVIVLFTLFLMALVSFGCAKAPEPDHDIEMKLAEALLQCEKNNEPVKTTYIDPKDQLLDKAITELGKAANKGNDPCASIITNNKLQAIAMQENTKQITAGVKVGESIAGNLVLGVLGWKAIDELPNLIGKGGDTYNLHSNGDMSLSDSIKSGKYGNITGNENTFGELFTSKSETITEIPLAE